MKWPEVLTLSIAAISLCLSGWIYFRQRTTEGRAHFTAEWESPSTVVYVNHGPGAARDVVITFEARSVEGPKTIAYVAPFQPMRLRMTRYLAEAPPDEISLSWRDNRRGLQELTIQLGPRPELSRPSSSKGALESAVRDIARDEAAKGVAQLTKEAARGVRNWRRER